MKSKKMPFALTMLMALSLTACGGGSNSDSNSESEIDDFSSIVEMVKISQRKSFTMFNANKKEKENKLEEFADRTCVYEAGTDNAFKLSPGLAFKAYEKEGDTETTLFLKEDAANLWKAGWSVSVKENGVNVDANLYEFDEKTCEIVFSEGLIGKTLDITVKANIDAQRGVTEEKAAQWAQSFTVKVISGVNVYEPKELMYFDDRDENDGNTWGQGAGDCNDLLVPVKKFKIDNGLDASLTPDALVFHEDMNITKDDVPSEFFYTAEELTGLTPAQQEAAVGSNKDYTFMYMHTMSKDITVSGNYYNLDFSAIPLAVRHLGKNEIMGEGGAVSHSSFFKVGDGNVSFKNLNITGNAKNYVDEGDQKYAGGEIFIKAYNKTTSVTFDNVLMRQNFITFMTEKVQEGRDAVEFNINNAICTDNYNSFLYNWGGEFNVNNSYFGGCGGPVVIQDHVGVESTGPWESQTGDSVYGYAPKTTFTDCEFNNYVTGQEAWFVQFGANGLSPMIKGMSDLYLQFGKSFVTDADHNAAIAQQLSAQSKASFFNFIALNKSGDAQGMTVYPVCGEVNFVNHLTEKTTFNYRQATDFTNYATHMALRQLNQNGAPVFETAGGLGTIFSQDATAMSPVNAVNAQLAPYYENAYKVLDVLYVLDNEEYKGLSVEEKILKIQNDDDYLKVALTELSAMMGASFVDGVSQMVGQDILAGVLAAAGLTREQYEGLDDATKQAIYSQAEAIASQVASEHIYPVFRPIVNLAYLLQTGKIYTYDIGLVDIVDLYRGQEGISKEVDITISEAVNNIFKGKEGYADYITIAELANKMHDAKTTVLAAYQLSQQLGGGDASTKYFGEQATGYTAIYYNGMMLVMGLKDINVA